MQGFLKFYSNIKSKPQLVTISFLFFRFLLNLVISNLLSCWLFTPILMLDGLMLSSAFGDHDNQDSPASIWSWSNPDLQIYSCSVFTIISVITSSTSVLSQVK